MNRQSWIIFSVTAAFIAGTGLLLHSFSSRQTLGKPGIRVAAKPVFDPKGGVVGTNSIDLPEQVLDYTSQALPVEFVVLDWLPKDTTYGQRLYKAADGFQTAINAVLMGTDRTSIHKPDYCLAGQGWQIDPTASEVTTIRINEPRPYDLPITKLITTREVRTEAGHNATIRGVYLYWLVADARLEPYHNRIMNSIITHMLRTGELQRWAYVTCFAACLPGQEEATFNRLKDFLAAAVPRFQLTTGAAMTEATKATVASVTD
jgi:hypothetical protein